jgi:deoxyribonuclease-1
MEDAYGFRISDQQRRLYDAWDKKDPPDEWEIERNRRITEVQGLSNRFIDRWTLVVPPEGGTEPPIRHFTCAGKTRCAEMASCEEATFYLRVCGAASLDGNNDGIACNALCR